MSDTSSPRVAALSPITPRVRVDVTAGPAVRYHITRERLLEVLDYSIVSGRFYWRVSPRFSSIPVGSLAGCIDKNQGYWILSIDGRRYKAHVLAWFYVTGEYPNFPIDHEAGVRHFNAFNGLRASTPLLNQQNRRGPQGNSTHGFMGVKYDRARGKWRAMIRANGKRIELGRRDTPEEAHELYLVAKRKLHEGCTL